MYTRCPTCQTYFKISAEQLGKAGGKVRCGQCFQVFNSIGNLIEQLPVALSDKKTPNTRVSASAPAPPKVAPQAVPAKTQTPPIRPVPKPAPQPPLPRPPVIKPASTAKKREPRPTAPPVAQDKESPPLYLQPKDGKDGSESFILSKKDKIENVDVGPFSQARDLVVYPAPVPVPQGSLFGRAFWSTGVAVLLGIFIIQYSYYMRTDLARYDEFRPWIQTLCEFAQCDGPLQQDISMIKLSHRDITSHPRAKGALLINAIIINNASFAQPFPIMQITLSDTAGQIIARRRFQPSEYLDADIDLKRGMPSKSPVQIVLEIADPGKNAVNFEFNFFYQNS